MFHITYAETRRIPILTIMKKLTVVTFVVLGIFAASSCDYDDSNDIDILIPNDSTETGIEARKIPN
ncbi:hypothetical protein CJ263_03365 [Maribacter cobaltidurans]|uniref:Uncharacterized protein n=1 Tax=Maribacter cobaltidurans TaxID=1178778 RepID=A0A223V1U3_9FLAO|nr:hypothetical protein CJ263_03365 [Maribacter cobaltidurans]GGD69904.1 hypothetical protein GCM10011412_04360 [Maribacter cobaltidurans]